MNKVYSQYFERMQKYETSEASPLFEQSRLSAHHQMIFPEPIDSYPLFVLNEIRWAADMLRDYEVVEAIDTVLNKSVREKTE